MAKRAARKIVKVDDCQRTLELRSPASDVGAMTIHIPDMLARSNRRQYEQARAYDFQLDVGKLSVSSERIFEIYTLSNAWWVKKSIEYAKAVYLNASKTERALLGDKKGKWNDFIIHTGTTGTVSNFSNLYQYSPATSGDDMTAAEVGSDESLFEVIGHNSEVEGDQEDGNDIDYGFTIEAEELSGSVRRYNIFDQYLLTRNIVEPEDTRAGPYRELVEVDQVAMKNLKESGDKAPYDLDAFPSPWVLADTIGIDQEQPSIRSVSKMITAPLGIVIVKKRANDGNENNFTTSDQLLLHVKKGKYKGVHAPAYKATKLLMESSAVSKFKQ